MADPKKTNANDESDPSKVTPGAPHVTGEASQKQPVKDLAGISKESKMLGSKLLGEFSARNGASGSATDDPAKAEAEAAYALAFAVNTGRVDDRIKKAVDTGGLPALQELVGNAAKAGVTTENAADWLAQQYPEPA